MAFEAEFLDVMVDTITWERYTGVDNYGNKQYAAPVQIQCRVSPNAVQLLDPNGEEVVSKASIYTAGDFNIGAQDRITHAGGTDPVIRVKRPPDGDGAHHVEVTI